MAVNYEKYSSDTRPWGTWECIEVGENFAVKKIVVNPTGKLSLQYHHHRDEHWIITQGTALVTKNEETITVKANQTIFIPALVKHRIENIGTEPVIFIEVQWGTQLQEDDIVRIEDIYGR